MTKSKLLFFLIVSIAIYSCSSSPTKSVVSENDRLTRQIDSLVTLYNANEEFSGSVLHQITHNLPDIIH